MKIFDQKLLLPILIFQLFANLTKAQIDTTVLYPLQIGNYWEYSSPYGSEHFYYKVINEKIMGNEKKYKVLEFYDFTTNNSANIFIRVEDNLRIYQYHDGTQPWEEKLFDFNKKAGSLWNAWYGTNLWARVILLETQPDYLTGSINTLTQSVDYVEIDTTIIPPDTIWTHVQNAFQKGIGPTLYGDAFNVKELAGAIINGVRYGYITSVEESDEEIINDYRLEQNYPNPFNPATQITYQIPKAGFVNVVIYNSLGQLVSTLVNERKERGRYTVEFNAENLPSGMYIYQITAGKYMASGKMLLMK